MDTIAYFGVASMLFLTLGMQLVDIAEGSSDKVISYAADMESAIDCAVAGVPIEQCSPNLGHVSFDSEIEEFRAVLNETEVKAREVLE